MQREWNTKLKNFIEESERGAKTNIPALQDLLALIERSRYDGVVLMKL